MIRINLLKPLQEPQVQPMILEEAGARSGKKRAIVIAVLAVVALAVIGVLEFPSLFGGLFTHEKTVAVKPISPKPKPTVEHPQPKKVTAQAVEDVVRDVAPERKPAEATYADLVPSQKIEFQYFACTKILKDIKAITPPDVGFANFIFTPPGEFYVHGLAADEEDLQRFKQGLSGLSGAAIKPGMEAPAGARGQSKEFSFFGTVKYPLNAMPTPPDRVVDKAKLAAELKQMKTVAGNLGIRLKEPKLLGTAPAGNLKKMIYQTAADCSFQQMQDFLSELHDSKSNLGFIKFDLHARGDEKVVADMDFLAYVNQ